MPGQLSVAYCIDKYEKHTNLAQTFDLRVDHNLIAFSLLSIKKKIRNNTNPVEHQIMQIGRKNIHFISFDVIETSNNSESNLVNIRRFVI